MENFNLRKKNENFKDLTFENQKLILENDTDVNELFNLGLDYKNAMLNKNLEEIKNTHSQIMFYLDKLNENYGSENIELFFINLENNTVMNEEGDKCKRNSNGSVDYSACKGFWVNVLVTIRVAFCPDNDVEMLYDCAQDVVCRTC